MKPFVGLPITVENTKCAYAPDIDVPTCGQDAVTHLMVRSEAWGVVSLLACAEHEKIGRGTGEVLDEHPAREVCRLPTGECWS